MSLISPFKPGHTVWSPTENAKAAHLSFVLNPEAFFLWDLLLHLTCTSGQSPKITFACRLLWFY